MVFMPEKPTQRPWSASRQRRHSGRRSTQKKQSETDLDLSNLTPEFHDPICGVDYRPLKEKIEDLEKRLVDFENNSTSDEYLQTLVLLQLYNNLEFGDCSIENARARFNLAKFYLDQQNLIPQAYEHLCHARQVFEQCFVNKLVQHLTDFLLGFDIYAFSIKCYLAVQQYRTQRDSKKKNKHIDELLLSKPVEDLQVMEEYLTQIRSLTTTQDYEDKFYQLLRLKIDLILINPREFDSNVFPLNEQIFEHIDKHFLTEAKQMKIRFYLRLGLYLIHFNQKTEHAFDYYRKAVILAEEEEETDPSEQNKKQLANVLFQWARGRVRADRLTDNTERKFRRAMDLHRIVNEQMDADGLLVMDDLATFYTKVEKYQDALNILCESIKDKELIFGEFSDEVIQTKSRIGAIYLRECEYLNAAEHLKECLELQEFVYGPKDSRTCQTRNALEIVKRDPTVAQKLFSETTQGQKQDRPAFRFSNKVFHEKEDRQLLLTVAKKPPIGGKHSS